MNTSKTTLGIDLRPERGEGLIGLKTFKSAAGVKRKGKSAQTEPDYNAMDNEDEEGPESISADELTSNSTMPSTLGIQNAYAGGYHEVIRVG